MEVRSGVLESRTVVEEDSLGSKEDVSEVECKVDEERFVSCDVAGGGENGGQEGGTVGKEGGNLVEKEGLVRRAGDATLGDIQGQRAAGEVVLEMHHLRSDTNDSDKNKNGTEVKENGKETERSKYGKEMAIKDGGRDGMERGGRGGVGCSGGDILVEEGDTGVRVLNNTVGGWRESGGEGVEMKPIETE